MSTASLTPEVADFAAAVRTQLADLTPDEREELAGGLEADLSDLVEERGTDALGDPVLYARELRSAAGLEPSMGAVREKRAVGETVNGWLDAAHERWDRAVTGLPGSPWEFVQSLRPAWWVLRAYVAVQSIDLLAGGSWGMNWVPTLDNLGIPMLVLAVVLSVQIGRGRLWPAGFLARVVLLGLNLFALAMVAPVFGSLPNVTYADVDSAYNETAYTDGITGNGTEVSNIYPYDADGQPLTGVQLFDQDGRPLNVSEYVQGGDYLNWTYPWTNVNGQVWNAFPMPEAPYNNDDYCCDRVPSPWTSSTPPTFLRPPLDQVPAVEIPDAAYGEAGPPAETSPEGSPGTTPEETPKKKPGKRAGR